jgi:hypothetical protein
MAREQQGTRRAYNVGRDASRDAGTDRVKAVTSTCLSHTGLTASIYFAARLGSDNYSNRLDGDLRHVHGDGAHSCTGVWWDDQARFIH